MTLNEILHHLRVQYGLSHEEPTTEQVVAILKECKPDATEQQIVDAIKRHCPSFGKNVYLAEDLTDLRDALNQLRQILKG